MEPMCLMNPSTGQERNACFCNSVLQILRRAEIFKTNIINSGGDSAAVLELKEIFSSIGSEDIKSAYVLRMVLGNDFDSGHQHDAKEILDKLISHLSDFYPIYDSLFKFSVQNQFLTVKGNEKWVKVTFFIGLSSLPDKPVSRPKI